MTLDSKYKSTINLSNILEKNEFENLMEQQKESPIKTEPTNVTIYSPTTDDSMFQLLQKELLLQEM